MAFGVSRVRLRVCLATILAMASLTTPLLSVVAQDRSGMRGRFPRVQIERPVRGAAVIDAAGQGLSQVADRYGKSRSEMEDLLRRDSDLWIDRQGLLYQVCEFGSLPENAPHVEGETSLSATAIITQQHAFSLHSRPGSSRTIYLDFDGHITSGTLWNQQHGRVTIETPAYDIDSNPTGFNQTELQRIQGIWTRAAEDFAPFDVDVTTEEPGPGALSKESGADQNFGIRVVIGGSSQDWYGPIAGGTSYIGAFRWDTDTPCFVFEEQLGNGNEKYTAEAVSHEAGHSLGLFHDGQTNGTAYYGGHGSWAPIMGSSYSREVTQWSKGDYSQANNTEDDLAVMQSNGLDYRGDDHGKEAAGTGAGAATKLSGLAPVASGVIERSSDADVFSFTTGAGVVSFAIAVAPNSPNLDVLATLQDALGRVVVSSNSPALATSLSATVPAGTYYLRIEGVGTGDAVTGYTPYGSLGDYTISGTIIGASALPPTARATANPTAGNAPLMVAFSSSGSIDPDGNISDYLWTFGDGSSSTAPSPAYTYTKEGTYTATLTVTDGEGFSSRADINISVAPAAKEAPHANASAAPTQGTAPLNVRFSSATSYDSDGTIVSYLWDFGTGATSNDPHPSYVYDVRGNYIARLTVTDNEGMQSSTSVVIEVAPEAPVLYIEYIEVNLRPTRRASELGRAALAAVRVKNTGNSNPLRARLTGYWSGAISGTVSGLTDSTGRVVFQSQRSMESGAFVFVVTGVSATGCAYDPTRNAKSSASSHSP